MSSGSIGGSTSTEVTVTWDTAFANSNYTVQAIIEESGAANNLTVLKIESHTTTQVVLRVQNSALTAVTGTIHLIGIAD